MANRINFLHVEIKVYPASIEEDSHSGWVDWSSLLMVDEPILDTYENLFTMESLNSDLRIGIIEWIKREMLNKGKEIIYANCPKALKK